MVDFQNILFPVSLTDISPVVAPYVATVASRFGARTPPVACTQTVRLVCRHVCFAAVGNGF